MAEKLYFFFDDEEFDSYLGVAKKMLGENGKVSFAFSWNFMAFLCSFAFFFRKGLWGVGFAFMTIFYMLFFGFLLYYIDKGNIIFNFDLSLLVNFGILWVIFSFICAICAKYFVLKKYFNLLDADDELSSFENSSSAGFYFGIVTLVIPLGIMFLYPIIICGIVLLGILGNNNSNVSNDTRNNITTERTKCKFLWFYWLWKLFI